MDISRRDCATSIAAALALATGFPGLSRAAQAVESLKDAASAKGIRYGALADIRLDATAPAYRDLFQRQCGLCAVDIWAPAHNPGRDTFNFATPEDANILAAASLDLPITGAHLLWYWHMPPWFAQASGRQEAAMAILGYARGIASHYRGKAWSWNAVNEALNPNDGQPLGLRRCWPLQQIGRDYIDLTFRAARSADPEAILAYNDSEFELNTPEQEARRRALLLLLDDLRRRNTPIDAVGLQSHLKYEQFALFDAMRYRRFLADIASRGFNIILTELDVLDVGTPSDVAQRDRKVADAYDRFLSVALDEPAVKAVINWGLSDRYTWLTIENNRTFARSDGLSTRPLPFDGDLNPTSAFDTLSKAFKGAPQRSKA